MKQWFFVVELLELFEESFQPYWWCHHIQKFHQKQRMSENKLQLWQFSLMLTSLLVNDDQWLIDFLLDSTECCTTTSPSSAGNTHTFVSWMTQLPVPAHMFELFHCNWWSKLIKWIKSLHVNETSVTCKETSSAWLLLWWFNTTRTWNLVWESWLNRRVCELHQSAARRQLHLLVSAPPTHTALTSQSMWWKNINILMWNKPAPPATSWTSSL